MFFTKIWESGEETAIRIGLDLDKYWNITPKQMEKYIKVYQQEKEQQAIEMDANNYNLGKYIAMAFHNPKKYPRRPYLYKEEEKKKVMTADEMDAILRKNTLILGGQIK